MLSLRLFEPSDEQYLVRYLNNPATVRYLSPKVPFPYTAADAQWWINTGSKEGITRAIILDGVLIGCIGARPGTFEYCRSAEIGYWLAEEYWGQGITGQALDLLIADVEATTEMVRLEAVVFEQNTRSARVLEKAGFEFEGVRRKAIYKDGELFDARLFGKVFELN
ncbi:MULTISPECIES: GNAT family protein [Pseudoalteromonas]|uniref:GNAT family N-acetyltransferase n=1 Tax=Pseudoalteromonas TaxID=53246 RepID=UPI00189165FB|nr:MULTISPECIES: GNAT family protein [Pseudoalteromonas]MCG7563307.1 GNAT family N-acetyltransferase [Pseudoalteromonas sp. McH1-42]MEC4089622.1 GNAT family protein [Pseudoalteromonas rubra]